jgi:hypothetical protein
LSGAFTLDSLNYMTAIKRGRMAGGAPVKPCLRHERSEERISLSASSQPLEIRKAAKA